jgi:hypothetical protein
MPTITVDTSSGTPQIHLESISRVSIKNITSVKAHVIMRVDDLTQHKIEFKNGGTVDFAYRDDGTLVRFAGKNIRTSIEDDQESATTNGVVLTLDQND